MMGYHLTLASDGRRPLFPDEASRRGALRALARIAGRELTLFNLIDEHLHAVVDSNRRRAGRLAQAMFKALSPIVAVRLEPARVRHVESRRHLEHLVRYVLMQGPHHGLPHHPALWSGSCFQDLVGARLIEGLRLQVGRLLPRFRLREVLAMVGLARMPIEPASNDAIFRAGVVRLAEAAATAAAVGPGLHGKSAGVMRAKKVSAQIGMAAGFSTVDLARALGVSARTVRRLSRAEASEPLARAIRVRLTLESAVGPTYGG